MDRVKFCPQCDEVLPWDVTACKECGAPVPADPQAFEKARSAKELELQKLRRAAAASAPAPPRAPILRTAAGRASPTRLAISIAVWCFIAGVIAVAVGPALEPPQRLLVALGYILLAVANLAVFWVIIHSAVVSAIRLTRDE